MKQQIIASVMVATALMVIGCGNSSEEEPKGDKKRELSMSHGDEAFVGAGYFNVGPVVIRSDYPVNRIYLRTTKYVMCDDYYGRDALDLTPSELDDTQNTESYFECAQTQEEADKRSIPIPVCSEITTLNCFDATDLNNIRYSTIGCYPEGFSHLERRVRLDTGGGEVGECITAIAALEGEDPATGERDLVVSQGNYAGGFYRVKK